MALMQLEVFKRKVNEIVGLIVTDVRMAEMNGIEFVKLAKGIKKEISVFL
jgi:two-component SAPR family response regulator